VAQNGWCERTSNRMTNRKCFVKRDIIASRLRGGWRGRRGPVQVMKRRTRSDFVAHVQVNKQIAGIGEVRTSALATGPAGHSIAYFTYSAYFRNLHMHSSTAYSIPINNPVTLLYPRGARREWLARIPSEENTCPVPNPWKKD
jgi:hypothetical protein